MMGAMYTSYNVVNQSYSRVTEKAKISRASRDLVTMLMRDIRIAGFKYYAGQQQINDFAIATTGGPCSAGVSLTRLSNLFEKSYKSFFFERSAVLFSKTIFSIPPVLVLTIGLPLACASIKLTGVPSLSEVKQIISIPE